MAILEVRNVSKQFAGLQAISRVDFKIEPQEILGLIGPNGAGKTTMVNLITGVHRPTTGSIHFKQKPITGRRPYQIGRMGISRTFQVVKPFPGMTVKENAAVGAMYGSGGRGKSARQAIRQAEQLSVASRKRLEMAKALAMEPELLLFDEVMAGLNFGEIDHAVDLIKKIRERGLTLLVIEHVMRAIKSVCDRIIVLHHGELIADGAVDNVLRDERVIKAYLGRRYRELTA